MLFIFLVYDFINRILFVYKGIRISNKRGVIKSIFNLFLASLLFKVLIRFSNIDIIVNTYTLLFLNNINETVFYPINYFNQIWVKELESYILITYGNISFFVPNSNEPVDSDKYSFKDKNSHSLMQRKKMIYLVSIQDNFYSLLPIPKSDVEINPYHNIILGIAKL